MEEKTIFDSSKIKEHNDKFLENLGNFCCVGKVPEIKKHNELCTTYMIQIFTMNTIII